MERFVLHETPLEGLKVLNRAPAKDDRGFFERLFCEQTLHELTGGRGICQVNQSLTREVGAVRGLHFQYPPYAETKIVSCVGGEIFDVAVDLRRSSRTFLQWFGLRLCGSDHVSLVIPEGFAHGFQVLMPDSRILYLNTAPYSAEYESIINVLDPKVAIEWPMPVGQRSERDARQPLLESSFEGIAL